MVQSGNIQSGFKFMSMRSMDNIKRRSWDKTPTPYTGIERFNILGEYNQAILVFTNSRVRLIVDGYVDLTVLNGYWDENESPLNI